ncbi:MAG: hypothetical protein C0467_21565 [Planctomycetaceae bacterium]|nr:hypothetical protein [Planctomycetaceae bacterium]
MRQRNSKGRSSPASRTQDILGCFDANLNIRRRPFDDAVSVCDRAADGPPIVPAGRTAVLRFGEHAVDLSGVLDWIAPLAERGGWTYYLHHHDNIVVELARIEPFERLAFHRSLCLFRDRPADEGGANLLGVVGARRAWVLVIENDNQGGFRTDFFGPADACRDLRSCLAQ